LIRHSGYFGFVVHTPLNLSFGRRIMTHEFDGKKYEKASAHQKEWGARLIEELGLRGTEHVLDLGCGDGTLTVRKLWDVVDRVD